MAKQKLSISLTWDEFKVLGNPDNADLTKENEVTHDTNVQKSQKIRIYLEKKKRRGKSVTVVKGISTDKELLEKTAQELKKKCGTGGTVKDSEIIIQGDKRHEIVTFLKKLGYHDVKMAGG